jgi:diguanylate cyclase (GGDEF)-like protein
MRRPGGRRPALELLAQLDPQTGLRSRRELEQSLTEALSAARRHDQELSLVLIEIDNFRALDDTDGDRRGAQLLEQLVNQLQIGLRAQDIVGRWAGEEFLVILPRTGEAGATGAAERLRSRISELRFDAGRARGPAMTVTVGVAQWGGESLEDLIDRVQSALSDGRSSGGNVVSRADPRSRRAAAERVETS